LKSVDDDLIAELCGDGDGADDTADTATAETADASPEGRDATGTGATATGGTGGTAGASGHASGDPASDTAWEAAQFLTFLSRRLVAAVTWLVTRTGALSGRALSWTADRLARTPSGRRRVESLLPKVALLVVGILLGAVLVVVFG
jgi:hypothetical protein